MQVAEQREHIDGLAQICSILSALAMDMQHCWTKWSIS